MQPRYDHDCKECTFLGTVRAEGYAEPADLYVSCGKRPETMFILRFSSIDDDYACFPSHRLHTYLDPEYWGPDGRPAKGKR